VAASGSPAAGSAVKRERGWDPARRAQDPAEFPARLREIARGYNKFRRMSRYLLVGPADCADPHLLRKGAEPAPEDMPYPPPRISRSGDGGTHGDKLYYLFVADYESYPEGSAATPGARSPAGQALVKEAWLPEEVPADTPIEPQDPSQPVRYFKDGSRLYFAAKKAGLFIMYKLDPKNPGTDEGWVYGTVTADASTVTSSGRVEACMNCHEKAPFDRLFGSPPRAAAGSASPASSAPKAP